MAQQQTARHKTHSSTNSVSIPDKLYFRIGDVSRLCSLPAYVLRFWETEFPQLKPNKGGTGQRLYRKRDVEIVLEIKRLLYEEGFTIPGARRVLTENRRAASRPLAEVPDISNGSTTGAGKKSVPPLISSGPSTRNASKVAANPPPANPRIKDLRKEMREILSLLGTDHSDHNPANPAPASTKRDGKKARKLSDEPTLF